MSISYYVGISSLGKRPLGGLGVEDELQISRPEIVDDSNVDFLYQYSYRELVKENFHDILKVSEINDNNVIDRYFIVTTDGNAMLLAKRTVNGVNEKPKNSSFVYALDRLMSKGCRHRALPLKAEWSEEDYLNSLGELFTPVVFNYNDRHSSTVITEIINQKESIGWLDALAIQGWFSVRALYNLNLNPPPHAGWEIQGSNIKELYLETHRPSMLAVKSTLANSYKSGFGFQRPGKSDLDILGEEICRWLSYSNLTDFKAELKLIRVEANSPVVFDIKTLDFYDPFNGDLKEALSNLDMAEYSSECAIVNNISDLVLACLSNNNFNLDLIKNMVIYRQLNDMVYIVFNAGLELEHSDYLVFDFAKHLIVHYGLSDVPFVDSVN